MLRTRSPLDIACIATHNVPFDLHVLSTPPAFVLSQNQTLRKELCSKHLIPAYLNNQNRNAQKKYLTFSLIGSPREQDRALLLTRSAQISLFFIFFV